MSEFDIAFETVCSLVKDFKQGEQHYLSHNYQEAEVRKDFIDKFFIALGWDVLHNEQKNPYEQEVKVEKGVSVSGAQKRADYSFSLGPRFKEPKFFVEAKKPAQDLFNADYYFQTIRYAWHKANTFAVLTNFEQFHILDCRYPFNISTILNKKFKQFHYSDYAVQEKFAEIYWLFSREAVADNSLEKVAKSLLKRKGEKIIKTDATEEFGQAIDEAFLSEIDGIREKLAKAFKKNDDSLNSDELTEATQRTINRLVFIRFLEDKEIEQEHYVYKFGNKGNTWSDFISLCRKLDVKYNGIVFKKIFIDSDKFKGPFDSEFYCICQDISHLNSRFLFNEIPIHILGSIYERFLGKVVNATDKRVKIEEKPEVRKAGGVFYTPKYIVDYIVQNTVGKLIQGKTPEQIAKLRFIDISSGSGSFAIGMLECLLDYHSKYYQVNKVKAKKDGCFEKDGMIVLSLKQKQKILQNNIYGVDIDAQAVEVTLLSLYLKMLEDETTATANEMQVLFHEKILPDMTKNIICGNSLIGTDILSPVGQSVLALSSVGQSVLALSLSPDEVRKLNPMDFETAFPEVFKSKTEQGYLFVPDVGLDEVQESNTSQVNEPMIPVKANITGGFDVVVGNPPYLKLTANNTDEKLLKYYQSHYKSYSGGSSKNLFQLFIERVINLSPKMFSYIIPEALLTTDSNGLLRELILKNYNLNSVVTFDHFVFEDATIGTSIIVLDKKSKASTQITNINHSKEIKIIQTTKLDIGKQPWDINLNNEYKDIFKKLDLSTILLKELVEMSKGMVVKNRNQVLEIQQTKSNLPFLLGNCISRYAYHYDKYADYNKLEIIGGTREITKHTFIPRLLVRRTGNTICAVYSNCPELIESTLYILRPKILNLKYLLGLLNSKLLSFYLNKKLITNAQGFPQILMGQLEQLPIMLIDVNNPTEKINYDKLSQLIDQMLQAKKQLQSAVTDTDKTRLQRNCTTLEFQIDNLVYELYRLTPEEIEKIEKV